MKEQEEQLCRDAVQDILSIKLLSPERISYVIKTFNALYENTNYAPYGPVGDFFLLYIKLSDFHGLAERIEIAKNALTGFSSIHHLSAGNLIKWLVKFEDDGLYSREKVKNTKVENYDELPNGSILLDPDFDIRIEINHYIPVIDFAHTFTQYYDMTMNKYSTEDATYLECGIEYYTSTNEQRRLMDYVRHLIDPPIEALFLVDEMSFDMNKLKNYVPIRVEHISSTPSHELQAAHDAFHQDDFEAARLSYTSLLSSRTDYQEAWLGLTISNFILGDYERAYIASSNLSMHQYGELVNYIEKYREGSDISDKEYEIADKTCEMSLESLNNRIDKLAWLAENRALYNSISIRPQGLPSIARCCLHGKHYENIATFHSSYCETFNDENILDTKTHLEAVIHFIEKMNIQKLDELLLKEYYSSKRKGEFMRVLRKIFDAFNASGDTVLYASPGSCKGCRNGGGGYTFLSNKSRNYIDFIIKSENNIVTDIFECSQFKNDNLVKSMLGKRITFYIDEPPF
jgi:hypothetical protein